MGFTGSAAFRPEDSTNSHTAPNRVLTAGSNVAAAGVVAAPLMIVIGALWAVSLIMHDRIGTFIATVAPDAFVVWVVTLAVGGGLCVAGRMRRRRPTNTAEPDALDEHPRARAAH